MTPDRIDICLRCADKYGGKGPDAPRMSHGTCEVCMNEGVVVDARDYPSFQIPTA